MNSYFDASPNYKISLFQLHNLLYLF